MKQGDLLQLLYWFMDSSEEMKAESCFLLSNMSHGVY